jgi:hypothetical protein
MNMLTECVKEYVMEYRIFSSEGEKAMYLYFASSQTCFKAKRAEL